MVRNVQLRVGFILPPRSRSIGELELIVVCFRYTSLGSTYNTFPNPLLKATDDPTIFGGWRPAWELKDETTERAGR